MLFKQCQLCPANEKKRYLLRAEDVFARKSNALTYLRIVHSRIIIVHTVQRFAALQHFNEAECGTKRHSNSTKCERLSEANIYGLVKNMWTNSLAIFSMHVFWIIYRQAVQIELQGKRETTRNVKLKHKTLFTEVVTKRFLNFTIDQHQLF